MDIKKLAGEILPAIKSTAEELSRLKGFTLGTLKGGLKLLPTIIKNVETVGQARKLTGAEKQQLAVELVLLNVKLPWWLPEAVVRPLLEAAVDAVVEAYKSRF